MRTARQNSVRMRSKDEKWGCGVRDRQACIASIQTHSALQNSGKITKLTGRYHTGNNNLLLQMSEVRSQTLSAFEVCGYSNHFLWLCAVQKDKEKEYSQTLKIQYAILFDQHHMGSSHSWAIPLWKSLSPPSLDFAPNFIQISFRLRSQTPEMQCAILFHLHLMGPFICHSWRHTKQVPSQY